MGFMKVNHFEELEVYKESAQLVLTVYDLCSELPKTETYVMADQLKRAVTSVGANIAESFGRYHYKDKINFLYHTRGSLYEVKHFLFTAVSLNFINMVKIENTLLLIDKIAKMLNVYIRSLKNQSCKY